MRRTFDYLGRLAQWTGAISTRHAAIGGLVTVVLAASLVAPATAHGGQNTTADESERALHTDPTAITNAETVTSRTTERAEPRTAEEGAHRTIRRQLTALQFISGASVVVAAGALWAAVLAYRGTD